MRSCNVKRVTVLEPFFGSLQHVLAEMERIDSLRFALTQVWRARQLQQTDAEFRGMYITKEEVMNLCEAQPISVPSWATGSSPRSALPTCIRNCYGWQRPLPPAPCSHACPRPPLAP